MSNAVAKSGLVFTIGLTGHRDIDSGAKAAVRQALRTELETLKGRFYRARRGGRFACD
jgi:hypothetical protein